MICVQPVVLSARVSKETYSTASCVCVCVCVWGGGVFRPRGGVSRTQKLRSYSAENSELPKFSLSLHPSLSAWGRPEYSFAEYALYVFILPGFLSPRFIQLHFFRILYENTAACDMKRKSVLLVVPDELRFALI